MMMPQNTRTALLIDGARFYAYHGVGEQETLVGNVYTLSLRLWTDLAHASETDDLGDTVNYAAVYEAVKQEMAIPSRLLEHVAGRVVRRIFRDFPTVEAIDLKLVKRNPPMGADVDGAGVEIHVSR